MPTRSPLLSPECRARLRPYALAALGCAALVLALDLLTNTLDTARYYWDFALYYDMAERGLIGNDNLIAPFVYRFLTPLLAGGSRGFSLSSTRWRSALHPPGTCSTPRRIPALS